MNKFEVGDRIQLCDTSCQEIFNDGYTGEKGIVIKLGKKRGRCYTHGIVWYDIKIKIREKEGWTLSNYLEKLEGTLSKYDEYVARINALDNGWDKEADDIGSEIYDNNESQVCYYLAITTRNNKRKNHYNQHICILEGVSREHIISFDYNTQCEKMSALKKALLYLLDHSDIKKDLVGQEVNTDIDGKMYKVKVLKEV